jgi:hypothetical protein
LKGSIMDTLMKRLHSNNEDLTTLNPADAEKKK